MQFTFRMSVSSSSSMGVAGMAVHHLTGVIGLLPQLFSSCPVGLSAHWPANPFPTSTAAHASPSWRRRSAWLGTQWLPHVPPLDTSTSVALESSPTILPLQFSAMYCAFCLLTPEAPVSSPYCRSTASLVQEIAPHRCTPLRCRPKPRLSGIDRPTPGSHSTAVWSVFGASSLKFLEVRRRQTKHPSRAPSRD